MRASAIVIAALLCPGARAAELGEITVRSYVGQQLAADIELVALAPDEQAGLQVRLAPFDVFQGANINMNPALSSVHMSVVRRDQRQFLHITTLQSIDANYLHLFLELGVPGRLDVRAATVWLQPDPHPAPPPPAPGASDVADAALVAAMARAAHPAPRAPRPVAPAPSAPAARPAPAAPAVPRVKPGSGAAACATGPAVLSARECVALDTRNAALSTKLVELEGKLNVLQSAFKGKAPGPQGGLPGASAAGEAASIGRRVVLPKLKYKKEKPVEASAGKNSAWWMAGAGALAALGGLGYYLLRRKRSGKGGMPLKIWQGWRRKKPAEAAQPAPVEPALEPE